MRKTKKQILAEYLIAHGEYGTAKGLMNFSDSQNLGVQVKTLDSDGNFVIKFSASDPWIKPSEWLHNYKTAIKQRYEEASFVYQSLFPQEETVAEKNDETESEINALKAEVQKWKDKYKGLFNTFNIGLPKKGEVRYSFPLFEDRARASLDKILGDYPNFTNPNTLTGLLIGYSVWPSVIVDEKLQADIDEICHERQAAKQAKK